MRAFFAVRPPDQVRDRLAGALEPLRDADRDGLWRWSHVGHLHLTLAFLGELPDAREEDLVDAAGEWARRTIPVRMRWAGAGAFPSPAAARVLWVGVEDADARAGLTHWARALRTAAARTGIAADGRRFRPHVTVARARRPLRAGRWVQSLDVFESSAFTVDEVVLVASHLHAGVDGRYEVRAVLPLAG